MNANTLLNLLNKPGYGKIDGEYSWHITARAIKEAEKPDSNGEINSYLLITGELDNGRSFNKTLFSEIDINAFITACAYATGKINGESEALALIDEVIESDIIINIRIETVAKKDALGTVKRYTNLYYTDVPTAEVIEETSTNGVTIIE